MLDGVLETPVCTKSGIDSDIGDKSGYPITIGFLETKPLHPVFKACFFDFGYFQVCRDCSKQYLRRKPKIFRKSRRDTYDDEGDLRIAAMWDGEEAQSWMIGMDGWTASRAFVMTWEQGVVDYNTFYEGIKKIEELVKMVE